MATPLKASTDLRRRRARAYPPPRPPRRRSTPSRARHPPRSRRPSTPSRPTPATGARRSTGTACRRARRSPTAFRAGSSAASAARSSTRPGVGTEISNGSPWGGGFQRYSGEKLFAPVGSTYTNVRFNVPGTQRQAFTSAFGVVLSDVDTTAGGSVTFLDARGATILEVPCRPARTASLRRRPLPRRRARRRGPDPRRLRPIAPGVVDCPQTDLAALDDVIFSEPQADLAPPPDTQFLPADGRRASTPGAAAAAARVADHAGQVRAPQPHAEGDRRQLGRHRGDAHARQGRPARSRSRPARPRSRSRSRPTPRRGKQKLVRTGGDVTKSVSVRVI